MDKFGKLFFILTILIAMGLALLLFLPRSTPKMKVDHVRKEIINAMKYHGTLHAFKGVDGNIYFERDGERIKLLRR